VCLGGGGAAEIVRLKDMGITVPYGLTKPVADQLIQDNLDKWNALPATEKQICLLRRAGRWREGMNRGEAAGIIGRVKDAGRNAG
jgi:hypothetical protein